METEVVKTSLSPTQHKILVNEEELIEAARKGLIRAKESDCFSTLFEDYARNHSGMHIRFSPTNCALKLSCLGEF